jgi:hypothetical protein
VLYSVAVDYDNGADTCIRNPSCLLYDVVEFFQAHFPEGYPRQEVLQFELYQSTKKEGNYLSLIRDPFEGGQFKSLYDGSANNDLGRQVTSLLKRYVKLPQAKKEPDGYVKLYKCIEKDVCNDIMFGAFPSEELRTGYCVLPGKG